MSGKKLPARLPGETQDEYTARTYALLYDVPKVVIRTDVPRQQRGENWDDYTQRVWAALAEGEVANGWRRRGRGLDHVGDSLEHIDAFGD